MSPRGQRGGMPLVVLLGLIAVAVIFLYLERHMFWQILISMGVVVGSTEGAGTAF